MDDGLRMEVLHAKAGLEEVDEALLLGHGILEASDVAEQGASFAVLQNEVDVLAVLEESPQLHHMWVIEAFLNFYFIDDGVVQFPVLQ